MVVLGSLAEPSSEEVMISDATKEAKSDARWTDTSGGNNAFVVDGGCVFAGGSSSGTSTPEVNTFESNVIVVSEGICCETGRLDDEYSLATAFRAGEAAEVASCQSTLDSFGAFFSRSCNPSQPSEKNS
jgi:hypothetical protein